MKTIFASLAAAAFLAPCASAVITVGPRQLVSSSDYLTGNRAQYVGRFGSYLGTPISPRHFITASHVGNAGGGTFLYRNGTATETSYQVTLRGTRDDLAIWELTPASPSFTRWTPVYTGTAEAGRPITVIGRGTDKGAEVRYPENTGALRGYRWGTDDTLVSWGTNTVSTILSIEGAPPGFGGDFVYFDFTQSAGAAECTVSNGDSSGPVFLTELDGSVKLAAINSLVDGNFGYSLNGAFFPAAIWDARGMYVGVSGNATLISASAPNPVPAGAYSTRISSRYASFIAPIINPVMPPNCGTSDFNGDGDFGTDADIEAFFACLGGSCCATCYAGGSDFNADGDFGTDQDIESFFRVLAGGPC
jgi:hypothetical protein